jgi:hypothetical protein
MHVVHKSMNIQKYFTLYLHIPFVNIISSILSAKVTCFIHTTFHNNYLYVLLYIIIFIIMHIHQSHTFNHYRIMYTFCTVHCYSLDPFLNVAPTVLKELYSTHTLLTLK